MKTIEYALVSHANPDVVYFDWTSDWIEIRSAQRHLDNEDVALVMREIIAKQMQGASESYDLEKLAKNILPVLVDLGLVIEPLDLNNDDNLKTVERIAWKLMPIFAESLAMAVVNRAKLIYSDDPEDSEAILQRNDQRRDKMFDEAGFIRNIGGVPGWGNFAGAA